MMSTSPLYGHGRPVRKAEPIIQKAGHRSGALLGDAEANQCRSRLL